MSAAAVVIAEEAKPDNAAAAAHGRVILDDIMFNNCPAGQRGNCIKSEYLDVVPDWRQCEVHDDRTPRPVTAAYRNLDGYFLAKDRGKTAGWIDGSILDRPLGEHVIANAWYDPRCELRRCILPKFRRLVPRWALRCEKHRDSMELPPNNPYPLTGKEYAVAERDAWREIAPQKRILPKHRGYSFNSCERTPAVIAAEAFCEDDDYLCRGMFLQGGPGCGKSVALACAIRRLAVSDMGTENVTLLYAFPRLVSELLDPELRDETFGAASEADTLILDDIGSSYVKRDGMVQGLFEELVIHREGHEYSMLASTNLEPKAFRAMFGDRVYDRIKGEWGAWINVDRPSLRQKKERAR